MYIIYTNVIGKHSASHSKPRVRIKQPVKSIDVKLFVRTCEPFNAPHKYANSRLRNK